MTKKSKAQILRMIKRAEARGETYDPPPCDDPETKSSAATNNSNKTKNQSLSAEDQIKLPIARKLEKELREIEQNQDLKAKERRSAKRKAEAIAAEASACPALELLEWYRAYEKTHAANAKEPKRTKKEAALSREREDCSYHHKNPYIAFIGQLSFKSTKESLFQHIKDSLGEEFQVTSETTKIRLLTDAKSGRSRGIAFVEVDNPEYLYGL